MAFNKFIQWADHFSEKISLFHVMLLSCLFALISIVNTHGGFLNEEMYIRLPFYMSDMPLLNKLFDSKILDGGLYRARELSYFLDFIDTKFVEFSIDNGCPHFLSLVHYLFSIVTGCLLWSFCVKELNFKPLIGVGWLALFWTTPSIFFGGSISRTGKIGVALLTAIIFYFVYKVVVAASIKRVDFQISKKVWFLYFIIIFSMTLLDEQGLFFAITVLVFLAIWVIFVRHKNIYIMLFIGLATVLLNGLYRYVIAPQLTCMLNGYRPYFFYWELPIKYFIQNLVPYLSAGFFQYVETFRFLIGNPPRIVGIGLILLFIFFPVFSIYIRPGLSANYRKLFILALVELLITNLMIIAMNSLMVLRNPSIMWPPNTMVYFWSPTIVILVMTLAILTNVFYKSRIPQWLVLMVMCFAIIGNIVAFPKHEAIFIREGQLYSSFQSSSAILNTFKNLDTLDNVRDPVIEKNPVFQFFKSRKKNNATGGCKILEFAKDRRFCIRPDAASVYNEKGIFHAKNGEYQLAIDYFNQAIGLEPANIHAISNRGLVYARLGQYQLAIADFSKTISLKPDFAEAFINRGIIYLIQKDNESGCRDAQKACVLGECKLLEIAKHKRYCR